MCERGNRLNTLLLHDSALNNILIIVPRRSCIKLTIFNGVCSTIILIQARIQKFTLVGAPWIGEGSGDRQGR